MNGFPLLRSAALRTRSTPTYLPRFYSTTPCNDTASPASAEAAAASPSSSSSSSTLDNIQAQLRASKPQVPPSSSFSPSANSNRTAARSDAYKWQTHFAATPSSRSIPTPSAPTPEDNWRTASIVGYSSPITTTTARSFDVKGGDVGRAFRMLNRTLRDNNVRRELKRQERFESGSDKRVRLDSERHRRRFKVAVGKAVSMAVRSKDR